MFIRLFASLALLAVGINASLAQDNAKPMPPKQASGEESAKVEVAFAIVHVPQALKAGMKVDLEHVTSAIITGTGEAIYNPIPVVAGLEVVSVTKMEKPADPEQAVKVELKGTKQQIDKVVAIKSRVVNVSGKRPDGSFGPMQKPPTLRLELAKSEK